MAKSPKQKYICTECKKIHFTWKGQCAGCGAWNKLEEYAESSLTVDENKVRAHTGYAGRSSGKVEIKKIKNLVATEESRVSTGLSEFDNVLGGGIVEGSVIMIGGDPGIGKSTILSQVLSNLSKSNHKSLYVTGEESESQVKLRTDRLNLNTDNISILTETNIEKIITNINEHDEKFEVIVFDSIQTMFTTQSTSSAGSTAQLRETTNIINRFAKENRIAIFIIGHVTKDGSIAGPKILEHIVDTVLYFEGEKDAQFRIIRNLKNRFGAVNEIGVFSMGESGLKEVKNPSAIFLNRMETPVSGSAILITKDGTKNLLVETQALVSAVSSEYVQRRNVGVERDRLAMMIAILQKSGIPLWKSDVFVSITGGLKITETAADLAIIFAIISSYEDVPLKSNLAVFGEVGLGGEIRPSQGGEERIKEAIRQGMTIFVIPKKNMPKSPSLLKIIKEKDIQIYGIERLDEINELRKKIFHQ